MKRVFINAKGVTLIELIVVIAIIAISAAIAVPGMNGWMTKSKVNSEARKIYSVYQLARSEAIRNNSPVQVAIKWGQNEDPIGNYSLYPYNFYCSYFSNKRVDCLFGSPSNCITPPTRIPEGLDMGPVWTGGNWDAVSTTTWEYTSRGTFTIEDIGSEGQTFAIRSNEFPNYKKTFQFSLGGSVTIK
jgi:prepilin-type N-terminal cleavage/methylation domain-containing protein